MDFATRSRARGAKYGKNKSRTQLHNFYDVPVNMPTAQPASKRLPISPSSIGAEQQDRDASDIPVDPPSPSPTQPSRPAHVTSHSRSSFSTSHGSRSASPIKRDTKPDNDVETTTYDVLMSTYDMLSSDDDLEKLERRPIKRPRLSPLPQTGKQDTTELASSHYSTDESTRRLTLTREPKNIGLIPSQEKVKPNSLGIKTKSSSVVDVEPEITATLPIATVVSKPKSTKATYSKKSMEVVGDSKPVQGAPQAQPTMRKSRTKLQARALDSRTPKKAQPPIDGSDTSGASPSQLGIDHLRLTTGTSPESDAMYESPPAAASVPVLPRGRKRMIDRLDAGTSKPTSRAEMAANQFVKEIERLHRGSEAEKPPLVSEVPKLSRTGSSQTRQTYGRSRNTYAKERSHLSDMVDDLDAMSTASSQGQSQQLLSGMLSSGPSQLQSQLEIESDSSEDAPAFRLKSIHELRQAGTNNRLEKEVEDLMVDINPSGGTKALRIQALMQIMRKMLQERFASFLFEHVLDRLTAWSSLIKDKISKLLLGMVFWRLINCNATSPHTLKQIIHCVVSNSSSLPPLDTIAQIAKTRAENLSKSTIRDLMEFEQTVLSEGLLPAYEGEGIIPAAITLGVLNDSLRKIIDAGTIIPLPQSSYAQIVALLRQVSQPSVDQAVKHAFVTKLALSLLQICAGPLEQDLGLSQAEYQALGDTLGDVMYRSLDNHESLVQAILHFAITLCNDKPNICEAVCQSSLTNSLMTIIRSRFMSLVDAAKDSQGVESAMLDSIILTLACLLNVTEYSNGVRQTFASSKLDDDSVPTHLSLLVNIYMDSAPRLRAVKTMEQGSASVMVGYLSLLICNLCLDEELWQVVSYQLSGVYSISDVVASAKELLIHMRTVENTDESIAHENSSATLDSFTMRFGEILSAVRLE